MSMIYKICCTSIVTMNNNENIVGLSSISQRFQITLTKKVRNCLGVGEGDQVVFIKKGDEIIIRKA